MRRIFPARVHAMKARKGATTADLGGQRCRSARVWAPSAARLDSPRSPVSFSVRPPS